MVSNPGAHPTRPKCVPAANQAEFAVFKNRRVSSTAEHFYDLMLESCERLFENDIEQQVKIKCGTCSGARKRTRFSGSIN